MKKAIKKANIVLVAMFVGLIFLATSNLKTQNVQADSRVICSGNIENNNISFMINVYQGNEYVENMLDIFDIYQVKTTFFVGGSWAIKNLELVKEIYTRGHEIGNHGFYHKDQNNLNFDDNLTEIKMCHEVISKNLGIEMQLFAPPSGAYNINTIDAATSLNYQTIMWTHDTIDWRDQDSNLIYKRATKDLSNGDLILMHPTRCTLQALQDIISTIKSKKLCLDTVSNTIKG